MQVGQYKGDQTDTDQKNDGNTQKIGAKEI